MQARALRVPEVCVNDTPPSCLVAYPFTKMEYRVLNMLVLPDPSLTQDGPVTFPACALHQLFVRSCDLAHHGLHCSLFCAYTHHSLLLHLSFRCLPSPLSVFRWKGSRMCSRHLAPLSGIIRTTRATHSLHHTLFNSYKMVRSPHLCSHLLTHRRLMVLLLQVSCPAHCYHAVQSAHKSLRVTLVMSQVS